MKQLSLSFLGGFHAKRGDNPITHFRSDKAQALLAYLCVEFKRAHRREALAGLLWSDLPTADALANLRQTLLRLRRALDDGAPSTLFRISTHDLQFQISPEIELDVHTFETLLERARAAQPETRIELLTQAVELYHGDFLAGFFVPDSAEFEIWVVQRREELHSHCVNALVQLTTHAQERGEQTAAIRFGRRLLAMEPWREVAHRQLMRALALDGQVSAALAQYETCRRLLDAELGVAPEAETELLAERIRRGKVSHRALTARVPRHNLPPTLTPFVGRDKELAALGAVLHSAETRLLTLVGPGGIGKTRLALAIATNALESHADGVYFVELAAVQDSDELAGSVAHALGLPLSGAMEPTAELLESVCARELLLILDNLEQVVDANTQALVIKLLQSAPRVQVLVTSRTALGLQAEKLHPVAGLEFENHASLQAAAESDAALLFLHAAQRRQTDIPHTPENLHALQRICRAVRGMPLALELAAAWSNVLTLPEIAGEIENSIDFLATDAPDVTPRQRSMRAVFDSASRLLSPPERAVFQRLAFFRGGITRAAAHSVTGASPALLMSLVKQSHLRLERGGDAGMGRYQIHELMRQYGESKLAESPAEFAGTRTAHGRYFMRWLAQRTPGLATREAAQVIAELRGELPNLRLALDWAIEAQAFDELEPVVAGWVRFYDMGGMLAEVDLLLERMQVRVESALTHAEDRAVLSRLNTFLSGVLVERGRVNHNRERFPEAFTQLTRALELAERFDAARHLLDGHVMAGYVVWRFNRYPEAQQHFEFALRLSRSPGTELNAVALRDAEYLSLRGLGIIELRLGRPAAARALFVAALEIARMLDTPLALCIALDGVARAAVFQNDLPTAEQHAQAQLTIATRVNDRLSQQSALTRLGTIYKNRGDYWNARGYLERAEKLAHELDVQGLIPLTLFDLGQVMWHLGDAQAAQSHWTRALALAQEFGSKQSRVQGVLHNALLFYLMRQYANALEYCERTLTMCEEIIEPYATRSAWIVLGKTYARLGQLAPARQALERAAAQTREIGLEHLLSEITSELAWLAVCEDERMAAHAHIQIALQLLEKHSVFACLEPLRVYEQCYRVLCALEDPRANMLLQTAQQVLTETANHLPAGPVRETYLKNFSMASDRSP